MTRTDRVVFATIALGAVVALGLGSLAVLRLVESIESVVLELFVIAL